MRDLDRIEHELVGLQQLMLHIEQRTAALWVEQARLARWNDAYGVYYRSTGDETSHDVAHAFAASRADELWGKR